ncbi:TRAP transporter small permease subunit [Pusillimonas sp. TS35]|uniref:TRAP transporter small permease n=1 Tax=Paracandidimonas lactea TaxID=2895524 RepID=UPI00136DCCCE|nr:TRAP transporter small permease [Paracandidimonas lactea]MYN13987.1 TRAP transporter small permease subunit [Pusillimonas sp. TS35]
MYRIEKVVRGFACALTFIAGVSLMLMMLQTVTDVVLNNFAGAPIEGNLEIISAYHMVLVVFLPLAYVELRHEHINADLFVRLMPRKAQRIIYVFGSLVSVAFFGVLGWQTLLDAISSYEINEVIMGSVYVLVWPSKFSLPIGFLAIVLVLLLHIWKTIVDPDFEPVPESPEAEGI